jgi:hypothetical protein
MITSLASPFSVEEWRGLRGLFKNFPKNIATLVEWRRRLIFHGMAASRICICPSPLQFSLHFVLV